LGEADALIIAAALTPETKGMLDVRALASLRHGSLLINIARGGVVDSMAVVDALTSGHLFGAGLDVTDPEPCDLPVEVMTHREMVINLKTAKEIDVTIPSELIKRDD